MVGCTVEKCRVDLHIHQFDSTLAINILGGLASIWVNWFSYTDTHRLEQVSHLLVNITIILTAYGCLYLVNAVAPIHFPDVDVIFR